MLKSSISALLFALSLAACRHDAPRAPSQHAARSDAIASASDATSGGAPIVARPRPATLRTLDGSEVIFAQPSRDGRRIAVGTLAGAIITVDGADGTPLRRDEVSHLAPTPPRWIGDTSLEVSVTAEAATASVTLDLATGRIGPVVPRVAQTPVTATDGGLPECDLAPLEGSPQRYRASGDWNGQVRVTDCETGERFVLGESVENPAVTVGVMTGGVGDLAWSPDGRSLAVPFAGVRVWDVARRASRVISRTGVSAVWRPGARELTVVERHSGDDERLVRLAANGDWRIEVSGWLSGRSRFAWSPDGARLAVAGQQGLWVYEAASDAAATDAAQTFASAGDPSSLAWSDEGTLALSMSGGGVYVWRRGRVAWSLVRAASEVSGASVSPDGRWLLYEHSTSSRNETIEVIWDLTRGRLAFAGSLRPARDGGPDWYLAAPDGWTAESALRLRWNDGTVIAYHPESRAFTDLAREDAGRHDAREPDPGEGVWSPDGTELASCASEGLHVAARRSPGRAGAVAWRAHLGGDECVRLTWSDDGKVLFVAGRGGLHLVRRRDGARMRHDLIRVGSEAHGVVFAPDGTVDTDDAGVSLLRALDGAAGDPRDQGMLARFFAQRGAASVAH